MINKMIIEAAAKDMMNNKKKAYKEALVRLEETQQEIKGYEEFFNSDELIKYTDETGEAIMRGVYESIAKDRVKKESRGNLFKKKEQKEEKA